MENRYLYHGSPYKLDVIEPRLSPCDEEPLVYASNQYEFALFYAGNDTNDLEINQSYYNGVYMLTEILPGMFRRVLDRPGYVYRELARKMPPFKVVYRLRLSLILNICFYCFL